MCDDRERTVVSARELRLDDELTIGGRRAGPIVRLAIYRRKEDAVMVYFFGDPEPVEYPGSYRLEVKRGVEE